MAEDLSSIDVSHLEGLAKIEADQRALKGLCEKAEWHRDKVVEVYTRVVRDYETRIRGLDEQANNLRKQVGEDLRRLDALHAAAREAVEQARVNQQESEFRFEIGEYTREDFQKRQQDAERTIADRKEEFGRIEKLRARYLELLPAGLPAVPEAPSGGARKPAPQAAPPASPEPPAPAPTLVARPGPAAESFATMLVNPSPAVPLSPADTVPTNAVPAEPVPVPEGPPPIPSGDGATSFLPPPASGAFRLPAHVSSAGDSAPTQLVSIAPPAPPPDAESFGTVAVSAALLVEDRAGLPGVHHQLGLHTMVGRTPDNQIVVPVREVSRKHAEIKLTEQGYMLRDLGSPNGTFVNGQRIAEHRLEDGDRIGFGGQVFVFKSR